VEEYVMAAQEPEELSREEREKRLSSAYNRASQALREAHRDEFNTLYREHAATLGVEWSPRLKPEERAEQELLTIFDAFPHLRERYAAGEEP
jgi:hypothetical protein